MTDKKRQHYVPQFYLEYFSKDKNNIVVYSIKDKKIVTTNAPIDRQCYENYIYSKDKKYEDILSAIECNASKVFEKILKTNKIPHKRNQDYLTLLIFVLYQHSRTQDAADQLNIVVDKMAKTLLKEKIKIEKPNGINIESLDKVRIFQSEPGLYNLGISSMHIPILMDLECKLVINNNPNEFITSDNPVVLCNKYYLKDIDNYLGLACKGLLIFLPLTPKHLIIFFDSKMYRIGGKKLHTSVTQMCNKDIDELNILQLINANKTIYTLSMDEKYLINLSLVAENYRRTDKSILRERSITKDKNGRNGKILWISKKQIVYNADISFIKINQKIPDHYKNQYLVRDPYLVELHRQFCQKVKEKELKPSDWSNFMKQRMNM